LVLPTVLNLWTSVPLDFSTEWDGLAIKHWL